MINRKFLSGSTIILNFFFLMVVLGGCATSSGSAKPDPQLASQYLEKGRTLEAQSKLPEALEQYKLALTADPQNQAATENRDRLSGQLSKLADARYDLGMKYNREGKYSLARKQFLIALKYQPDHAGASKMLSSHEPESTTGYFLHKIQPGESLSIIAKKYYGDYKKYDAIARFNNISDPTLVKPGQTIKVPNLTGAVVEPMAGPETDLQDAEFVMHTIQPGQSISKLAQLYYGDYKKFHLIAQFNKMDDATQVKVGDRVKIPKVAGVPFHPPAPGQQTAASTKDRGAAPGKAPQTDMRGQKPAPAPGPITTGSTASLEMEELAMPAGNGDEQILAYRDAGVELFKEGRYEDAIFELNKSVEALPHDELSRSYLAKAYYESGKSLLNDKEYDSAKEAFESALQFDPACKDCPAYIEKSKAGPLVAARQKGMQHFQRNEYGQAITALEQYLRVQPNDNEARTVVGKAYFQRALVDYNKSDYLTAKKGFELALEYDSQCERCSGYIKQSLESHKDSHYNQGNTYYGGQQLQEAIDEWDLVYKLDPNYKDVAQKLTKARALMEKLEQIKKSKQP